MPLKDPTSDMAIIAKKGSHLVREVRCCPLSLPPSLALSLSLPLSLPPSHSLSLSPTLPLTPSPSHPLFLLFLPRLLPLHCCLCNG